MSTLPHRRLFLAACVAAGIASAARPGHSAEVERQGPRWAPDPRPWAVFMDARNKAEQVASTPAGVEAVMLSLLGPLPWRFVDSPWGACVIAKLVPMGDPVEEGETTGVWAVIRYVTADARSWAVLYQVGKLRLTLGKRAEIVIQGWQLSDLYGTERVTLHYEHIPYALPLRTFTISESRYHEAVTSMVAEIERKLATDIVPPFVLMPGATA